MTERKEQKVTYNDGGTVRVLRGVVTEDKNFIEIERRDGIKRLNKSIVLKIEEINNAKKVAP